MRSDSYVIAAVIPVFTQSSSRLSAVETNLTRNKSFRFTAKGDEKIDAEQEDQQEQDGDDGEDISSCESSTHSSLPPYMDPSMGTVQGHQGPVESKVRYFQWKAATTPLSDELPDDQDTILVFSGLDTKDPWNYATSGSIFYFSFDDQKWKFYNRLPEPRCYAAADVIGPVIYITGGYSPFEVDHGDMMPSAAVFSYCLKSHTWRRHPDMNVERALHATVAFENKLFVFGGLGRSGCVLPSVEMYDPVLDAWEIIDLMPESRMGMSACSFNGQIWIFGGATSDGENQEDHILSSVYSFSPTTKTWAKCPQLTTPRAYASVCVINEEVWILGGATLVKHSGQLTLCSCSCVERFSPVDNKWYHWQELSFPRHSFAAVHRNNEIYVIGGMVSRTKTSCNDIECINVKTGRHSEIQPLPVKLSGCCAISMQRRSTFKEKLETQRSSKEITMGKIKAHSNHPCYNTSMHAYPSKENNSHTYDSHTCEYHRRACTYQLKESSLQTYDSHTCVNHERVFTNRVHNLELRSKHVRSKSMGHERFYTTREFDNVGKDRKYDGIAPKKRFRRYSFPETSLDVERDLQQSTSDTADGESSFPPDFKTLPKRKMPSKLEALTDRPGSISLKGNRDLPQEWSMYQPRRKPSKYIAKLYRTEIKIPKTSGLGMFNGSNETYRDATLGEPVPSAEEVQNVNKYEAFFPKRAKQYKSILKVYLDEFKDSRSAERLDFTPRTKYREEMAKWCEDEYELDNLSKPYSVPEFSESRKLSSKQPLESSEFVYDKFLAYDLGPSMENGIKDISREDVVADVGQSWKNTKRKYTVLGNAEFQGALNGPYSFRPYLVKVCKRLHLRDTRRCKKLKFDPVLGVLDTIIKRLETSTEKWKNEIPLCIANLYKSIFSPDITAPAILVTGGLDPYHPFDSATGNVILRYHVLKNRFEYAGRMPESRCNHCLVFLEDMIYVIGGCDPCIIFNSEIVPTNSVMAYDFKGRFWNRCRGMSCCRSYHNAVVVNGKIFVLGGRDENGRILSTVEVYHREDNTWSECKPLQHAVMGAAACSSGSYIFIIGGVYLEDGEQCISRNVMLYDTESQSALYGPPLPVPVTYAAAVWTGNSVCVIGGLTTNETSLKSLSSVLSLDCKTKEWYIMGQLSIPRHSVAAVALESCIYTIGGMSTLHRNALNTTELLSLHEKKTTLLSPLPIPLTSMAAVVLPPGVIKSDGNDRINRLIKNGLK